jgi:hypothetical protein
MSGCNPVKQGQKAINELISENNTTVGHCQYGTLFLSQQFISEHDARGPRN